MADTVIRIKREEGFTVLPNALLRDQRLSLKTKGLFCMGRDAIRSALRELEAAGYLEREKVHGERGRFSGTVYTLHTVSKTPWTENPPMVETGEADPPLTGFPTTADPTTENPPLQNKDNINTPYSPPEGDADGGGQNAAGPAREPEEPGPKTGRHEPDRALFDQFWAAYPRKQAKEKAWKAWKKLDPDAALCRRMAEALERHRRSQQWQRDGGAYIPYPASWLNGHRWEDETDLPVPPESSMLPEGGRWV